jgi:hypothetical protein
MLAIIRSKIFCLPISYKILKIKVYKTVLPAVPYGCETWSLTLREELRLLVFEDRVLRRIFGTKREEDGSWRKLHNDELHSLYASPHIVRLTKSRRMRWAGHVARMGERRGVYGITGFLLGGPKLRDRWKDLGIGGRIKLRWTLGREGPMAGFCEHGNEPSGSIKKAVYF